MNDFIIVILATIKYVTDAPLFWLTMGTVSAVSIFVGAILYDGILPVAIKGMISVGLYASFIIMTHMIRVNDVITDRKLLLSEMSYAGVVAIFIITIFWITGVILGVYVSHKVRQKAQLDTIKK
jgi:hypothetical protein